jgi:hypothetical protein
VFAYHKDITLGDINKKTPTIFCEGSFLVHLITSSANLLQNLLHEEVRNIPLPLPIGSASAIKNLIDPY